jgi:hypothetical protein
MSRPVFLIVVSLLLVSPATAQTRCPAGDSGCNLGNAADRIQERVDQGRRDVQDAGTMRERVDAVQDTLKDCLNCGMDAVKGGGGGSDD